MGKVYAVRVGRKTGIFASFEECEKQIKGFSRAEYRKFSTTQKAEEWLTKEKQNTTEAKKKVPANSNTCSDSSKKIYAVRNGENTGIFYTLEEYEKQIYHSSDCKEGLLHHNSDCKEESVYHIFDNEGSSTHHISDCEGRIFDDINEAQAWLAQRKRPTKSAYAYTDASFNEKLGAYGYGIILIIDNKEIAVSGADTENSEFRNIAGECVAIINAVKHAKILKVTQLKIYSDCKPAIELVSKPKASANVSLNRYYEIMTNITKGENEITITYEHVAAHKGIEGNNKADRLARTAIGL